jgi:hypothetical protein
MKGTKLILLGFMLPILPVLCNTNWNFEIYEERDAEGNCLNQEAHEMGEADIGSSSIDKPDAARYHKAVQPWVDISSCIVEIWGQPDCTGNGVPIDHGDGMVHPSSQRTTYQAGAGLSS